MTFRLTAIGRMSFADRPWGKRVSALRWRSLVIIWSVPFFFTGAARAHDTIGVVITGSDILAKTLARAERAAPDEQTRSVLNNLLLWPVPRKLTICFLGGSHVLRTRVIEAMTRLWPVDSLTGDRLQYDPQSFSAAPDCGATPTADIRVAFKAMYGYWSYVGVESRAHVQSMNLQDFTDTTPSGSEFDGLVGHEMGHALGLEHEHQSPAAQICGWNYDYLFSHYVWQSRADMHANLDRLQDELINGQEHEYIFSLYDQTSLMHYYFEPQAFADGVHSPCYIQEQAITPSQQDLSAIRVAYGTGAVGAQALTKSASPQLSSMLAEPEYASLRTLLTVKAGLLP